jgi:outer membrane receptor for Fe3+-dicitrate
MEKVKLGTDDIHQMLRRIPGVNIQEEEGYGLRPNIGMRGTGTDRNSKITMMEDGVLVAPAPYAAPAAYYSPTAGRMESLEVRKGSSQVKYGPITTGGVLNYVSTSIPSTFQLRGTFNGGGDNTRKTTADIGDSYRNFGWLIETFQFRNDGFKELAGGGDTGVELSDYLTKVRFNTTPTDNMYQEVEIKVGRTEQTGDETYLGLTDADFQVNPMRRYAASQVDVLEATHEQYQVRHLLARRTWDLTTVAYRNNFHRAWYKLQSVLGSGLHGGAHRRRQRPERPRRQEQQPDLLRRGRAVGPRRIACRRPGWTPGGSRHPLSPGRGGSLPAGRQLSDARRPDDHDPSGGARQPGESDRQRQRGGRVRLGHDHLGELERLARPALREHRF